MQFYPHFHSVIHQIHSTFSHPLKAWNDSSLKDSWEYPPPNFLKLNFDVAVRDSFMVSAAVVSDHEGSIVFAFAKKLPVLDIKCPWSSSCFTCCGCGIFLHFAHLTGITAINNPYLCIDSSFAPIVEDISF